MSCQQQYMSALFDCFAPIKLCPQVWQPFYTRAGVYKESGEYQLALELRHQLLHEATLGQHRCRACLSRHPLPSSS